MRKHQVYCPQCGDRFATQILLDLHMKETSCGEFYILEMLMDQETRLKEYA